MKKFKNLLCLITVSLVLLISQTLPVMGYDIYYISPAYGRLSEAENVVYRQILDAIMNFEPTIRPGYAISRQRVQVLLNLVELTAPEYHYWRGVSYRLSPNGKTEINLKYTISQSEAKRQLQLLNDRVNEIFSGVSSYMDDFECLKYFHDTIINNCRYDLNTPNTTTAYGALVEGRASCQGYSKAMILLCRLNNIDCIGVSGISKQTADSEPEKHMWNMVQCDRNWYHMDVTWDDPIGNRGDILRYDFFNLPDADIYRDHQLIEANNFFDVPTARLNWANYFVKKGLYAEDISQAQNILQRELEQVITNGSTEAAQVKLSNADDYKKFYNWLFGNEGGIEKMLNKSVKNVRKRPLRYHYDAFETNGQNIVRVNISY